MKQSPDFILRSIADSNVLVPVGAATKTFPGMVTMNATGVFLWRKLETEQTAQSLADALLAQYDCSAEQAKTDVDGFLKKLQEIGAIV